MGTNIYEYYNARQYLRDFYECQRQCNPKFSYRYVVRRLGKRSPSYFADLLKGRIRFHESTISSLARILKLVPEEAEYFRFLCLYTQSRDTQERGHYQETLMQLNRLPIKLVDASARDYYKRWYHGGIRALLDILDFKGDPGALAQLLYPAITPKRAKESLQLLRKLGLVEKDARGFWKPTEKIISVSKESRGSVPELQHYHLECLDMAREILLDSPPVPKKIMTETMSLSGNAYVRIEARLKKLRNEVLAIIRQDSHPREFVYHLSLQLLPLSRMLASSVAP